MSDRQVWRPHPASITPMADTLVEILGVLQRIEAKLTPELFAWSEGAEPDNSRIVPADDDSAVVELHPAGGPERVVLIPPGGVVLHAGDLEIIDSQLDRIGVVAAGVVGEGSHRTLVEAIATIRRFIWP